MNLFDRVVMSVAPETGLKRLRARAAARVLMNYDAASTTRRSKSWVASSTDADTASRKRDRIAFVARDMVRNTPLAGRGRDVIVNNTVGDGIIPAIEGVRDGVKARFLDLVRAHLDTTDIDADGRHNFYGIQRVAMSTIVESGEVLIRIRRRRLTDGLALPFQLQVLEPDYIDTSRDTLAGTSGARVFEGIEYDAIGRRTAYYLFDENPNGSRSFRRVESRRVPASEVIHVYRQDRPGQMRGVSWFAPVALTMQDLRDYFDAQLMRQKIAACFAAFRIVPDANGDAVDSSVPSSLAPGAVFTLGPGDDIKFGAPPSFENDEFVRDSVREIAMGLGITYESFFGDLSQVNYSSARMGRMEMDRNISSWQWLMLVPQMLDPVGRWFLEYWKSVEPTRDLRAAKIKWTPPARVIVDPTKEFPAIEGKIRAGLSSWQREVRALGEDPETVAAEIAEDNARFDRLGLKPTSDPRQDRAAAPAEGGSDDG